MKYILFTGANTLNFKLLYNLYKVEILALQMEALICNIYFITNMQLLKCLLPCLSLLGMTTFIPVFHSTNYSKKPNQRVMKKMYTILQCYLCNSQVIVNNNNLNTHFIFKQHQAHVIYSMLFMLGYIHSILTTTGSNTVSIPG